MDWRSPLVSLLISSARSFPWTVEGKINKLFVMNSSFEGIIYRRSDLKYDEKKQYKLPSLKVDLIAWISCKITTVELVSLSGLKIPDLEMLGYYLSRKRRDIWTFILVWNCLLLCALLQEGLKILTSELREHKISMRTASSVPRP